MRCVFLICIFLCSSSWASFNGLNRAEFASVQQRWTKNLPTPQSDDSEIVDNSGGGYSFFRKQHVDVQPHSQTLISLLPNDLFEYNKATALTQSSPTQMINSYADKNIGKLVGQHQQQSLSQFNPILSQQKQQLNGFGQISRADVQTWPSQQQIFIPQTNLNNQHEYFSKFNRPVQEQSWRQIQQPISSNFLQRTEQERIQSPMNSALFNLLTAPKNFVSQQRTNIPTHSYVD